ncbi:FMRFamide receptor-like [Haliotis cracherodii]|uniref:FMRFamide receptor-like n=1 Tax=Haliotis cracherodii TaxID=6455 RepID=UPI0039ED2095
MDTYEVLSNITNFTNSYPTGKTIANSSSTEIRNTTINEFNSNSHQLAYEIIAWVATVIAICGVFGNILGAVVLHRMQKTNSGVRLLKYLSLVDIILLVLVVMAFVLPSLNRYVARTIHAIFHPFAYLLAMTLYTFEIYLTVLIAIQRWIAIALPFKSGSLLRESVINKVLGTIAVFTVAFNVPLWLAFWPQAYWNPDMNMYMFYTKPQGGFLGEYGFNMYSGPVMLVFRCVIPLILLVTCNFSLMISRRRMNSVNRLSSDRGSIQLTVLAMAITTMSVVTHVVTAVQLSLVYTLSSTTNLYLNKIASLLVVINCSTNFIFYYSFGKTFRQNFKSCFRSHD